VDIARNPQGQPTARTMTFSLTPEESEKLLLIENHPDCHLRLALRAAGDSTKAPSAAIDFNPALSLDAVTKS
jgi:Flp pilus assembly protein CpaB